jgi:hypothetical protein
MRRHAGDHQHLYGHLMRAMADDWEQDGPTRSIYAGWEDAPVGAVVQLRLLAGLFRIVLSGRAPELEPFYPCLGGTADPADVWPIVRAVLAGHVDELRDALMIAPQTNEVGRANALLVGLFAAVARTGCSKVRLLEPGASAGLNLLVDRFRFVNRGWAFGPSDSPVRMVDGILGEVEPVTFEIVERHGCDPAPLDVTSSEDRFRLRSFVWPFQLERHERLVAALELAAAHPPQVERAAAGEWLEARLAEPPPDDVVTVVWHSITRQYWPAGDVRRGAAAIRAAARLGAVAHVSMEYPDGELERGARLTLEWSAGPADPRMHGERLGSVADHGLPVRIDD